MSLNWVPVFAGIDNCSKLKHFQTSHRLIPLQQSVGWQHWWRSPKGVRTAVRICQWTYWNFAAAIHQRLCIWDIKGSKKCNLHAEEEHFWKIDTLHPIYLKSSLQGLLAPWCHGLGQAPDLRWDSPMPQSTWSVQSLAFMAVKGRRCDPCLAFLWYV